MTHQDEDRLDKYLWDPGSQPDESAREIERRLSPLRFDPHRAPLPLPPPLPRRVRPARAARRWWPQLAAAALLLLTLGGLLALWRWSWPAGRAWSVAADPGTAVPHRLAVGHTLRIPSARQAVVEVARIGTLRLAGDSVMTLRATRSNRHRLTLERGSVHVRVWAPPFSVVFQTPAGTVGDMGCVFDLQVEPAASRVRVRTGWVQLENERGEMLVPAGAHGLMLSGRPPSVPVYEDAPRGFLDAVRALEEGRDTAEAVERIVRLARRRDVLTLLMLIHRHTAGRELLANRAAALWPPPDDSTVRRILAGDSAALWQWYDTLPLPPAKSWWWNWRDALPRWLAGDRR